MTSQLCEFKRLNSQQCGICGNASHPSLTCIHICNRRECARKKIHHMDAHCTRCGDFGCGPNSHPACGVCDSTEHLTPQKLSDLELCDTGCDTQENYIAIRFHHESIMCCTKKLCIPETKLLYPVQAQTDTTSIHSVLLLYRHMLFGEYSFDDLPWNECDDGCECTGVCCCGECNYSEDYHIFKLK
jgi:hypothetical protein